MADAKLVATISVLNKASAPLRAINSDLNKLRAPVRGLASSLKGLDRASGFKELRASVRGLGGELGKLGAISAGIAGGLVAGLNKMAQTNDEVVKTATNFGMSTDAIQEWRFVAERSGVSIAAVNKSMQAFTKRLAEARNGSGELHGLLSKVNPEFLKQLLAVKDNAKAYELMLQKMSQIPDQQRQILLGDKAFSESGREFVKITSMRWEEIVKLRKEAHELGAVLDKETLNKSVAFSDALTNLGKITKGLAFAVGAELIPEVKNLITDLNEWYLANKDVIRANVIEFAKKAAAGIREFAARFRESLPEIKRFVENIGGLKTIAIAVGAIMAGPLLSAISGLAVALTATPLGWAILGFGALIAIGKKLYDNFEPFRNLIQDLNKDFKEFRKFTKEIGEKLGGFAFDLFGDQPEEVKTIVRQKVGKDVVNGTGNYTLKKSAGGLAGGGNDFSSILKEMAALQQRQNSVKGEIALTVKADSSTVRVEKVKTNNPDFGVLVDSGFNPMFR